MGLANRRHEYRVPLQMFLTEYIRDQPHRSMSFNLSSTGLYINRLSELGLEPRAPVGLEFELPGTGEVIWARGEVRYDTHDSYFHGTGVKFTGMPGRHERLVDDYVRAQRAKRLRELLDTVRRNRMS